MSTNVYKINTEDRLLKIRFLKGKRSQKQQTNNELTGLSERDGGPGGPGSPGGPRGPG